MRVIGRLAQGEGPVLFARVGEVDKCEFIKANAPVEEWSVTDDGAGLLVKTSGLREQAREVLVSAVRSITPISPAMGTYLSYHSGPARTGSHHRFWHPAPAWPGRGTL